MSTRGIVIVAVFAVACGGSRSEPEPPPIPSAMLDDQPREPERFVPLGNDAAGAVFMPIFDTLEGPVQAGMCFVLEGVGASPVLITAHHLFGLAGGMSREYAWHELASLVSGATAINVWREDLEVQAGPPIPIEGAVAMSQQGLHGDIAALSVLVGSKAYSLHLATARPERGDEVWLVAPVQGVDGPPLTAAVVSEVADEAIVYAYDRAIDLNGTSGAPVVNAAGEVVAINLGGGEVDGRLVGIGNPAWAFRDSLAAAVGAR